MEPSVARGPEQGAYQELVALSDQLRAQLEQLAADRQQLTEKRQQILQTLEEMRRLTWAVN